MGDSLEAFRYRSPVSIVRVDNGKIADWTDYYDGLMSRRTALAAEADQPRQSSVAVGAS
jgi:hypothetical protein